MIALVDRWRLKPGEWTKCCGHSNHNPVVLMFRYMDVTKKYSFAEWVQANCCTLARSSLERHTDSLEAGVRSRVAPCSRCVPWMYRPHEDMLVR